MTRDEIFKITKHAVLEFDDSNPRFIAFKNLNPSSARMTAITLKEKGYSAKVSGVDKQMIIIER